MSLNPSDADGAFAVVLGEMLLAHDADRRCLARKMHDQTLQLLTALSMDLAILTKGTVSPERRTSLIAECAGLAEECCQGVRELCKSEYPPLLDELGLRAALQQYATANPGLGVELLVSDKLGRLDKDAEAAIFRIVQEQLTTWGDLLKNTTATVRIDWVLEMVAVELTFYRSTAMTIDRPGDGRSEALLYARAAHFGGILDTESGPAFRRVRISFARERLLSGTLREEH